MYACVCMYVHVHACVCMRVHAYACVCMLASRSTTMPKAMTTNLLRLAKTMKVVAETYLRT